MSFSKFPSLGHDIFNLLTRYHCGRGIHIQIFQHTQRPQRIQRSTGEKYIPNGQPDATKEGLHTLNVGVEHLCADTNERKTF
jgi:hypothetical protein